jgi:hypothetical protein
MLKEMKERTGLVERWAFNGSPNSYGSCKVCGSSANDDSERLCNNCRELESKAESLIQTNPRQALEFFRDLVIMAGRTLRAETKTVNSRSA